MISRGLPLLFVFGLAQVALGAPEASKEAEAPVRVSGKGIYRHIICDPAHLELWWKGQKDDILRTFAAVDRELGIQNRRPVFLMNGGIFEPGGVPSGLLVIGGKELRPINLRDGKGNFFLKPSGVFYIAHGRAGVIPSTSYGKLGAKCQLAVQSGPMLLVDGKTHHAFREGSKNQLHRNGVGVDAKGRIHFLMTEPRGKTARKVNLWGFADAFRKLGCQNALFLDGDISQCFIRGGRGNLKSNRFGSIFAVSEKIEEVTP
jgi:uncharacterized protein YigE (DUF2233 family)